MSIVQRTDLGDRRTTTRSGRTIAFRTADARHSGRGLPVVLLHGIFSTADHWFDLGYVEALVTDRSVVAIDAIAHGASDRPDTEDELAYGLRARAADVVAVLDELHIDRAHVWGYSMGGWTACGIARYAPDRLASLVVSGWDPSRGLVTAYEAFAALLDLDPATTDWYGGLSASGRSHPSTAAELDAGDDLAFRACHRACEDDAALAPAILECSAPTLLTCGIADPYHGPMETLAGQAGADFASLDGDHGKAWVAPDDALATTLPFLRSHDRLLGRDPQPLGRRP